MIEENFEPKMKVKEFYKYIKAPLKIISGFNGKVLCRNKRQTFWKCYNTNNCLLCSW